MPLIAHEVIRPLKYSTQKTVDPSEERVGRSQKKSAGELTRPENISKLESQVANDPALGINILAIPISTPPPPSPHCLLGERHEEDTKGDPKGSEDGEEGKLNGDALGALRVTITPSTSCNL